MSAAGAVSRRLWRDLGVALVAVVTAALLRKVFLDSLETRITWVTYYPRSWSPRSSGAGPRAWPRPVSLVSW